MTVRRLMLRRSQRPVTLAVAVTMNHRFYRGLENFVAALIAD
jgi:hypothetical protein